MEPDFDRNRELILDHERIFARQVAGKVIDKPQLMLWMILIPVFFVFYFFQLKRYKRGLRDFSQNFLTSRQRTLNAVCEASLSKKNLDLETLVEASDTPEPVKNMYRAWIEILAEHFLLLIEAEGDSYDKLVKAAYKRKSNYQQKLKKLNRVEADFHHALASHLPGDQQSIRTVIKSMRDSVNELQRSQAAKIFS